MATISTPTLSYGNSFLNKIVNVITKVKKSTNLRAQYRVRDLEQGKKQIYNGLTQLPIFDFEFSEVIILKNGFFCVSLYENPIPEWQNQEDIPKNAYGIRLNYGIIDDRGKIWVDFQHDTPLYISKKAHFYSTIKDKNVMK